MAIEFEINGHKCLLDEEDKDLMDKHLYLLINKKRLNQRVYLQTVWHVKGKRYQSTIHRIVLSRMMGRELLKGEYVDHIDMNGLNNKRDNLRIATQGLNNANTKLRKDNTLGIKGVWRWQNKYRAGITVNGNRIDLGVFSTADEARAAYCRAAKEYFGEFARFE